MPMLVHAFLISNIYILQGYWLGMADYSPGDTVEVSYAGKTLIGTLMPRVEQMSQDVVVLKLDNGYNVGLSRKKISEIKLVKKYQSKPTVLPSLQRNPKL